MSDMGGPTNPDWAPLEPEPEGSPRQQGHVGPSSARETGWGPPTGPPGWAPPPPSGGSPYGQGPYGAPPQAKAGDARTGPLPLHPMSVGDVLDGAFKLLKANVRTILLVVASIVVPLQLVSAFVLREQVSPGLLNVLRDPTVAQDQA